MKQPDASLIEHAANVHSQSGEDGVVAAILDRLPSRSQWCVEFGAWDGLHHSNTANLIQARGYHAVLIEPDTERFADLARTYGARDDVHRVQAFVGFGPEDSLDVLLRDTPIPKDFDVLSIDIDGNDYHCWNAVTEYTPKVIVIEYNPTIPNGVHFVQAADPTVMHGSSIDALAELGKRKGYELVAVTRYNGIFVRRDLFAAFGIADNSVHALRVEQPFVTHIFCGYDGTVFLRGHGKLPWHDVPYVEALMQPLPRFLRQWTERYGPVRTRVFGLYKRARRSLGRRLGPPAP
jgi:hypothetical protein